MSAPTRVKNQASSLAAAVGKNIVAVRALGGEGYGVAIQKLQGLCVVGGERVIGEKDSAGIHHAGDAGHREPLLEAVVVDKNVRSYHQIEASAFRKTNTLRD